MRRLITACRTLVPFFRQPFDCLELGTCDVKILIKIYLGVVLMLLSATAAAKLWEVARSAQVLNVADPVLSITNWQVMLLGAVLELIVIAVAVRYGNSPVTFGCLLWLAGCFLLYQGGRVWVGAKEPCLCLGVIMTWVPLTVSGLRFLALFIASFLFLGSAAILAYHVFATKRACAPEAARLDSGNNASS